MTPHPDLWKGEGWFVDLSNLRWTALGRNKFWDLFIDYESNYCVSRFMSHKDNLEVKGLEFFKKMRAMKIQVKMIRMYNTGEKKILQKSLEK